jgi:FAD/FMN-containing dehydrogenase/Fe-S oxidoreductase
LFLSGSCFSVSCFSAAPTMTVTSDQIAELLRQTPLDHERFAAHRDLEARLKVTVSGEVRFDLASRALYAADASNYRQLPVGVVLPRDAADVETAMAACRAVGAAILPRGAGTSVAGQTANVAVVLDFSRYMNRLGSLDPAARLAVVEPGIVLDRLREAAEQHHLTYGPDPATHSRCTLGGMIGNNSCGVHGLMAGKVVDNVESLDILLYDGTRLTVGRTSEDQLRSFIAQGGRIGGIYSRLKALRDQHAERIRERFPRIPRRVSGYNLDELLPENGFNVARALVGSEGTCATILSATLNLTDSPPFRILTVLAFDDPFHPADVVPRVLELGPIGLEGFDGKMVSFMLRKQLAVADVALLPPGEGFLLVEMGGWTAEEAQARTDALVAALKGWRESVRARTYSAADAARVWHVRESGLGATVFVPGEPERHEGWDDAGVPPEKLGAYLRGLTALMAEYGYSSPLYGHYGQGCAHLRINFDFHSAEGLRKFREFLDRAADLVLSLGGSLSGEHGDGQARAALLPKMFGPELVEAFREFKAIWDPDNRMNPGKLADAVRVYDPVQNLRHSQVEPGQRPHNHTEVETHFVLLSDEGSLERATARCVGVGACLQSDGGVMCPSYRATRDEQHSTRGRARLLWEMLAGALRSEGFQSEAVHEALDLCLSCKACKTECPVAVDMATYKAEFLAQKYKGRIRPLHHYVFGYADKLARIGALTPALTNALLGGSLTSPLVKYILGVAQKRPLPRLADQAFLESRASLRARASLQVRTGGSANVTNQGQKEGPHRVVLWADTWNNYYHPQTLAAAETVLTQAGFQVTVPDGHICCGRPLYDFGLLDSAKSYLANTLERVGPQIDLGLPFIFLEPSCASVFRNEMLEFFPNESRAQKMSSQVWLLADWLGEHAADWVTGRLNGEHVLLHGHCHHKAVFGGPAPEVALLRKAGAQVELIQSTCCGMAGPFGFEKNKFEVSKAIANLDLLPAIEAAGAHTVIVTDGFSCREQISHLAHRSSLHFAEVLAGALRPRRNGTSA